jgi:hypothetical protein
MKSPSMELQRRFVRQQIKGALVSSRGMSFPKKGKSFPKKGKSFPKCGGDGSSNFSLDDHAFAIKIALELKSELKDRNSRAKLVASWTGANERTVKNWILGRYAPCGRHLVILAQHSDHVLNAALSMAGRQDSLFAGRVEDLVKGFRAGSHHWGAPC